MTSLVEQLSSFAIGSVDFVSPSEIKVVLDLEAPQTTALNTGSMKQFPRINSYLLIPAGSFTIVGMVTWIGIEKSPFPKRVGLKDFGLVDLPYPLRRINLTPLGTLTKSHDGLSYELERGIPVFPSVGDPVLLPTDTQLKSIVENVSNQPAISIGKSPIADNANIYVNPDKLFGRHLAVLGNTGSGKSCTVAGLIRWSLEQARIEKQAISEKDCEKNESPNARFIILDPNGEYHNAFNDIAEVRVLKAPSSIKGEDGGQPLVVPAWLWNSYEWSAFAQAAPKYQKPILLQSLRCAKSGLAIDESVLQRVSRIVKGYYMRLENILAGAPNTHMGWRESGNCGRFLDIVVKDCQEYANQCAEPYRQKLNSISDTTREIADIYRWSRNNKTGFNDFSETDLRIVYEELKGFISLFPKEEVATSRNEDAPVKFDLQAFPQLVMNIAVTEGSESVNLINTLVMRIRELLSDSRLSPIIAPHEDDENLDVKCWLKTIFGQKNPESNEIVIIDLSLIPSDILHIIVAVIARVIFETSQRYRRLCGKELPTVLVVEEAHNFVKRSKEGFGSDTVTASEVCNQTFEKISKEGRKFGLSLVLSSQRASEIPPTILSQCNTFLLHRITNDQDQQIIKKLVPDNLGSLLDELPSLPSRQAFLLGWATPVPTLVEINELAPNQRPQSDDPKFWDVWVGKEERKIDWDLLIEQWIEKYETDLKGKLSSNGDRSELF